MVRCRAILQKRWFPRAALGAFPMNCVLRIALLTAAPLFALLAFSSYMKFSRNPQVIQGFTHLGLPPSMILTTAILEALSIILFIIPSTSVLGAILVTGRDNMCPRPPS